MLITGYCHLSIPNIDGGANLAEKPHIRSMLIIGFQKGFSGLGFDEI